MEHAIIYSDLSREEIQPKQLINQYVHLIEEDIKDIFKKEDLVEFYCPTNYEKDTIKTFVKMGMKYCISKTFGNIYISPRPNRKKLIEFYRQSKGREFWLNELLQKTISLRNQKIFKPHIEWLLTFVRQYLYNNCISFAEYYPNHWGYYTYFKEICRERDYKLVEPLFIPDLSGINGIEEVVLNNKISQQFDVILLFEALDRSEDPSSILKWVYNHLKSGGLCFITCLLASGFEVQILGQESSVFTPPERMNLFSFEGMYELINKVEGFEILEFSTPGVLDIPNIIESIDQSSVSPFFKYIFQTRKDSNLILSFQEFLQMNKLSTFGRLVLKKS